MKNLLLAISLSLSCSYLLAQTTKSPAADKDVGSATGKVGKKVLLIPFQSKMYISDIHRQLAEENEMGSDEVVEKFRSAMDQNMFIALKENYSPLSFYTLDREEASKELSYIYASVGYHYKPLPEEDKEAVEEENKAKKFLNKFTKKTEKEGSEEEQSRGRIENGQIVTERDDREKYMKTVISNDRLMGQLVERYQADYFLFINQIDFKKAATDHYDLAEETYKREVKVHYTIYDKEGNVVASGAKKAYFSNDMNQIDQIIRSQFPLIAKAILKSLNGQLYPDASEGQEEEKESLLEQK